jgi:hypothetical protein
LFGLSLKLSGDSRFHRFLFLTACFPETGYDPSRFGIRTGGNVSAFIIFFRA